MATKKAAKKEEKQLEKKQSKIKADTVKKTGKALSKKAQLSEKKEEKIQANGNGDKQTIIGSYAVKKGDTGSPEVQIALLSNRIDRLSSHLGENKKDNHSRRGLLGLISKRRRLLLYLQEKDGTRYQSLIKKLGLKK